MRLLIDGRVMSHRLTTGAERYATRLIEAFNMIGLEHTVIQPASENRYLQQLWEHTSLPMEARKYDVLFCPGNISPLWKPAGCKYVVSILDVSFKSFKDAYSDSYRYYYECITRRVAALADRIVTISHHEKERIIEYYPELKDKVSVVYLGVDDSFKRQECVDQKEEYILYVGTMNPRKNYQGVIEAFGKIADRIPHRLFIVGAEQKVYKGVETSPNKKVVFTGFVNDEKLIELYRKASVFVFPSFYEGFGLPPLEAMACGCPVIASNVTSLPEVVGDAAVLVDPNNSDEIADAIVKVISDDGLRKNLIRKGVERVKQFSWEKTAEQMAGILHEVCEG